MLKRTPRALLLIFTAILFSAASTPARQGGSVWIGTWSAAPQLVEPANALPADELRDATLRQTIHLSIGGSVLRLRISNSFGVAPLHLLAVHIARPVPGSLGSIDASTDRAVTFSGSPEVTIPAGAEYVSDPVRFPVAPLSDLTITIRTGEPPVDETGHPGSRATSFVAHGDWVSASELPHPEKIEHWYLIAGVDVLAPARDASVVVLGDSITDGHASTTNENNRWTDFLARRFQSNRSTRSLAVLNEGIGGNRLLLDGLGPNALARFDRDVLAQAGAHYLIVLEGINDIGMVDREGKLSPQGHRALVSAIIGAYQQMILRAHAHGIDVIGATLLPFVGSQFYHPSPAFDADRQAINAWIRAPGHFDAVIDFDRVMRDPKAPDRLLPAFDSGDHLHPSPVGYSAMADAVPLSLFVHIRAASSLAHSPHQR
ncbi:MAG: SGNH/GDSL hydrolase family protein [Candidatus Acidiferrales bacterium]